jgi:hypothetical protein
MIKSDFGTVVVKGEKPIILAEFSTIVLALRNGGFSDAEIDRCVERTKKPKEELAAERKKHMEDVIKSMFGDSDDKATQPDGEENDDFFKKLADIVEKALKEN